jgi:hypothetical protein
MEIKKRLLVLVGVLMVVFVGASLVLAEGLPSWVNQNCQKSESGDSWLFSGSVYDMSLVNIAVPLARSSALSNMATSIGVAVNSSVSQKIEGSEIDGYTENVSVSQGYPILVLQGGPGSAKSTTTRLIKELIDPNEATIRAHPSSFRDMMISAKNSWVLAFDNLSEIPRWLSDAFCQLSTGGGYAVRKQYTNSSEQIFNAKRPVILNGIDYLTGRSDLADRSIIIELPAISDGDRLAEKAIWQTFNKRKAYICGELFDGISQALKNLEDVDLKYTPRMADFTRWVVAGEPAMYWKNGLFLKEYEDNQQVRNRISLYNDDMATYLLDFMSNKKSWKGTADDLIGALKGHSFNQNPEKNKIPSSPVVLAKKLRRATHVLEESGLKVTFDRSSTKRKIKIKWRKKQVK